MAVLTRSFCRYRFDLRVWIRLLALIPLVTASVFGLQVAYCYRGIHSENFPTAFACMYLLKDIGENAILDNLEKIFFATTDDAQLNKLNSLVMTDANKVRALRPVWQRGAREKITKSYLIKSVNQ